MNRTYFIFLAYLLIGVAIYVFSLQNPFIYDDATLLVHNEWLHWHNIPNLFRSFIPDSSLAFVGYRPLVLATFAVENELFGKIPWVFRLDNLLLHVWVSFFVYQLSRSFLSKKVSFWIGLLFLVHPVQSNVITLVWKRTDLLLSLGLLGAIYFYLKAISTLEKKWIFLGHLFSLIAFFSKESALVLLPTLFLFHFFFWKKLKVPPAFLTTLYIPVCLFTVIHTWIVFWKLPSVIKTFYYEYQIDLPPSTILGTQTYFFTQALCFWKYIQLALFPAHLQIFHFIQPIQSIFDFRFIFALLGMGLLFYFAWIKRKTEPLAPFSLLWFFILWIPYLRPLNLAFDEDRLYLPLFLILFMVALAIQKFQWKRNYQLFLGYALVLLLSLHSFFRAQEWKDEIQLLESNIAESPQDPRPWSALAQAFSSQKRFLVAAKAIERAIFLDPNYSNGYLIWANALFEMKKSEEALQKISRAIEMDGFRMKTLNLLQEKILSFNPSMAFHTLWIALRLKPLDPHMYIGISNLLEKIKDIHGAYRSARLAYLISPLETTTQLRMATLLWKYENNKKDALDFVNSVLKNDSQNREALFLKTQINERLD